MGEGIFPGVQGGVFPGVHTGKLRGYEIWNLVVYSQTLANQNPNV